MQSAIAMEENYQGVTQEERMLLRQLFDKIVKDAFGTEALPHDLTNQGENNDIIN